MTTLSDALSTDQPVNHTVNANATSGGEYPARAAAVIDAAQSAAARKEIAAWPGYTYSPLIELRGLACAAELGRIWYKDESQRFGLGSFKALGGAYAVAQILREHITKATGQPVSSEALFSGEHRELTRQITVTCATDGNHGRSVAWGARQFGCGCVIYIHATVSAGREQAIAAFGAQVVRTEGNYDDSVRTAAADAEQHGRVVVSDTSYPGYMSIPRYVMQGYTVLASEAIEQLPSEQPPTHVFLQGGVGGFAAAIAATLWRHYGAARPRTVIVEPDQAACLYASAKCGVPTAVAGDLDTIMAGLACGEVSLLAWEILDHAMDDVLTVTDHSAAECMRLLAAGVGGDAPIVAGESAVAGLVGALLSRMTPNLASQLGLNADSRILVIGTEGDTDPDVYREIVGRSGAQVLG